MRTGIFGKLRGKGRRHTTCPSCGRVIDLARDPAWLGDGGWHCGPCGELQRRPAGLPASRERSARG